MGMKQIQNILFEPRVAFVLFTLFMIGYLVFLDEEGAFSGFFEIGPSENTKFLNMTMNTWPKVIIVYIIGFTTAVLQNYYSTVMFDFIHSKLWNPAYHKTIDISRGWASLIVTVEPLMYWLLNIIQFFTVLTMKFQFLVPQLLGQMVIGVPYGLFKISQKSFCGD